MIIYDKGSEVKTIQVGHNFLTRDKIELTFNDQSPFNQKVRAQVLPNDVIDVLPLELAGINDEQQFVSYCKFACINTRISGGQRVASVYHDKPSGSITPRSEGGIQYLTGVEAPDTEQFRTQTLQGLENEIGAVVQLNINNKSSFLTQYLEKTDKVINTLANGIAFKKEYQQSIRLKDLSYTPNQPIDKPKVTRFGINPDALSMLVGQDLDPKNLHPIEKELFKQAFETLSGTTSGEELVRNPANAYPNNVVLVDIFVRKDGKIKKDDASESPETHTVALWKKTDTKLLLIDPSKVDYSKELLADLKRLTFGGGNNTYDIQIHQPPKGILYGTGGKETGYSDLLSVSIEKHKYRDCIDVAVKIGFELNELQICENPLSLEEVEAALNLQISNQKDVATYLSTSGLPNRASLSTDIAIRHYNRQLLENSKK